MKRGGRLYDKLLSSLFNSGPISFSDNKFSNVPSFSKHFKVLKFHVRNQIHVWAFLHFTTHSRVINSRQNVFKKSADFRSYKSISVRNQCKIQIMYGYALDTCISKPI